MHSLYFVRLAKERAATAQEAISEAEQELDDNHFCDARGGYFGGGICDGYVIGGKWSGILQELAGGFNFFAEVKRIFAEPETGWFVHHPDWIKEHDSELQALWEQLGASGRHAWSRDRYKNDGADDDAMQITATMISSLKADGYRDAYVFDPDGYEDYPASSLDESAVGDWLVAIDYHS